MRFTVLASGSGGNASLVQTDGFGVLIDAGLASLSAGRLQEAEERTTRAESLARERKAALTEHRARLQLASIKDTARQPAEVLKLVDSTLPFFEVLA